MSVSLAGMTNGTTIVIGAKNSISPSQIFKLNAVYGGYKITAQQSGKVLGITAASKLAGAVLSQSTSSTSTSQIFKIISPAAGIYQFQNVNSSLYLNLTNGSTADGTNIIQSAAASDCAERFTLELAPPLLSGSLYRIISTCSADNSKVLAVSGGSQSDGAPLVLAYKNTASNSQVFKFETVSGGYKITNLNSNKVFNISGSSLQSGAALQQSTYSAMNSQIFKAAVISAGVYSFKNLNSGLLINLVNSDTTSGTAFTQSASNNTCAQKYKLETAVLTDNIFIQSSFWYQQIPTTVTLHTDSINMAKDFYKQKYDYGNHVAVNINQYSSPVYYAAAGATTQKVTQWDCQNKGYLDSKLATMWASVPIPANAKAAAGTDMEMTVYQPSTGILWEFWKMRKKTDGTWEGCWGGMQNVTTSYGAFSGYYGTTATSLPFVGGQITREELLRGEIRHAIGIALPKAASWKIFSWPAQRSDGGGYSIIPEGIRFRLDPSINVDALNINPVAKIVAKAGQKYGFIVWDKAGTVSIRAEAASGYQAQGLADPYGGILNNYKSYDVLDGIPWDRMQFLPMNYGKPL